MAEDKSSQKTLSGMIVFFLPLIMICQLLCSYVQVKYPKLGHVLPEVGIIILVGVVFGSLIGIGEAAGWDSTVWKDLDAFSPTLFFVGLLPPIIFNSGFHLKRKLFFVNMVPILGFAIVGTLLSTAMVSVGLNLAHKLDLMGGSKAGPHHSLEGLTPAECWTFGSLISVPVTCRTPWRSTHARRMLNLWLHQTSVCWIFGSLISVPDACRAPWRSTVVSPSLSPSPLP